MQFIECDDSVVFGTRIPIRNFPDLVEWHLTNIPGTLELELEGKALLARNFVQESLDQFIRKVCQWGGYAGIAGRILSKNPKESLEGRFQEAYAELQKGSANVGNALKRINLLRDLGTPSFSSKHLRFLSPEMCPVLDARVARLGYDFTPEGYQTYADDCQKIRRVLSERGIINPIPQRNGEWFVSDIDMALFAYISGALKGASIKETT